MTDSLLTYDTFCEQNPLLHKVVSERAFDFMVGSNEASSKAMDGLWKSNLRSNIRNLYKKCGAFAHDFTAFGFNKATVAVGAGPSLNLNVEHLKEVYDFNCQFELKKQPFVIIASNHQFKPLMEDGIHPHFVLLVDAGHVVYRHLCEDVPKLNKWTILVASLQTDPKVLKTWKKLGGEICFFLPKNDEFMEEFKKLTNEDPEPIAVSQGGNVMNTAWMLSINTMKSTVFMALGNDLSFPFSTDYEARKSAFYADGDYQVNIDNKRDEAADRYLWMGFKFINTSIILPNNVPAINFELRGISRQLGIYKTWIEMQVGAWANKAKFHYYNCSEQGSLGVLAKDESPEALIRDDNWYLMDEIYPKRWHTRRFKDAIQQFMKARITCQREILTGADTAVILPHQTGFVRPVGAAGI